MRTTVKVPVLGESVDSIVVVQWLVAVGDAVTTETTLVTLETDKVDTDMPSPLTGTLVEILAEEGAELNVGDPLCVVEA